MKKGVPGPAFVAPGRVNGPSCGTGGISGTTGLALSSCSSGMKSPHSVRRRPPTELFRFWSSFRMWVFGFAMERRLTSIGSTRLAFGRSWAILGLLHETLWAGRGCNRGLRGRQDQYAFGGRVVQARPGQLDLLQLAENLCAKGVTGALVAGLGRGALQTDGRPDARRARSGAREAKVR